MKNETQPMPKQEFNLSKFNPEPIVTGILNRVENLGQDDDPVKAVRKSLIGLDNRRETLAPTILALIQGLTATGNQLGPQSRHSVIDGYLQKIQEHDQSYRYSGFDNVLHIEYAESRRNYGYFLLFEDNQRKAGNLIEDHLKRTEDSGDVSKIPENIDEMDNKTKVLSSIKAVLKKEKSLNEKVVKFDIHLLGDIVEKNQSKQDMRSKSSGDLDAYFLINPGEENKRAERSKQLKEMVDNLDTLSPQESSRILVSMLSVEEMGELDRIRSKYQANIHRARHINAFRSYKDPAFRSFVKANLDDDNLFPSDYLVSADNIAQEMVELIAGSRFAQLPSKTKIEISKNETNSKPTVHDKLFSHLTQAAYHAILSEPSRVREVK